MGIALLWPRVCKRWMAPVILVKNAGSGIGGRETSWLHNQWKKTSKEHTNRLTSEV